MCETGVAGWVDVDVSAKGAEEASNAGKLLHAANVSSWLSCVDFTTCRLENTSSRCRCGLHVVPEKSDQDAKLSPGGPSLQQEQKQLLDCLLRP